MTSLDLSRLDFDGSGVRGMAWPVSRAEVMAARERLLRALVSQTRPEPEGTMDPQGRLLLRVLFKWIAVQSLEVYQSQVLHSRLREAGPVIPPSYFQHWTGDSKDPVRPTNHLIGALQSGPGTSNYAPLPLRRLVRDLQWNSFSPKLLFAPDLERQIIALNHSQLVIHQARLAGRLVRYRTASDWFGEMGKSTQSGGTEPPSAILTSADGTLEVILDALWGRGVGIPPALEGRMREWLRTTFSLGHRRMEEIQSRPERLPSTLWIANAGELWSAFLSRAVRVTGGEVVGHDHGHGLPYVKSLTPQLVQFDHCDVFIVYSETQAETLRKTVEPDLLVGGQMPVIRHAEGGAVGAAAVKGGQSTNSYGEIRTLMYVGAPYMGDRLHLSPTHPDVVALDWQARLFAKLGEWGIRVLHKPHPEGSVQPPQGFAEAFGHVTLSDPFEQVMDQADGFFFDDPLTTTFPVALGTGKPVVLLDLQYTDWLPEAWDLLERRCRVVTGGVDQVRILVDWDEVREAICGRQPAVDMSFVKRYHESLHG